MLRGSPIHRQIVILRPPNCHPERSDGSAFVITEKTKADPSLRSGRHVGVTKLSRRQLRILQRQPLHAGIAKFYLYARIGAVAFATQNHTVSEFRMGDILADAERESRRLPFRSRRGFLWRHARSRFAFETSAPIGAVTAVT